MMVSACVFVCGGVVGVVCCLRTQECALFKCGLVVFEKFVVVSAGWDIRVGCRAWGALVCLVLCVLIVFCFVSSSLFFESYGIMRLLFVL